MDLETSVKLSVYRITAATARVPDAAAVAAELGVPVPEVVAAFAALHGKRLLVPEPGDPARIRMAPPFSGVETAFRVTVAGRVYHAPCVWDAYGIPAALHEDGVADAVDGHTGEPMRMEIRDGRPVGPPFVAHFAVPAARWWEDIVHT